jgi:hypothetical protein
VAHRLEFTHIHSYATRNIAISLPIALRSGSSVVDLVASIDTGASHCLFESAYASELGLDLTAGILTRFKTANSSFDAFGHPVEIDALGILTQSLVYFFAEPAIVKNVLGRRGWLDTVRLGIIDYDQMIYLAKYDRDSL